MTPRTFDVVIIGGGPAGSTAATLLARAGREVLVLEKDEYPRFHIGESLLPADLAIFERLGLEPNRSRYVYKPGARFRDERVGAEATYAFADGLPGTPGWAWHVERAVFDADLLDISRREGASVSMPERALEVELGEDGVRVRTDRGTHRARYLIDATGQDAFLARRRRTVEPIRGFGLAAVFCHYRGLTPEITREVEDDGNIEILIHEHGWGWVIPLKGSKVSAGVVTREQGVTPDVLVRAHASSPLIRRLSAGAEQTPPMVIRNFSFKNVGSHGSRWVCLGDSACFLDPVFSSGVTLAMHASTRAADLLIDALERDAEADPELMAPVEHRMERAYATFSALIHRFYHTKIIEHLFFHPDPDPEIRAGLISVLAGDVWRDDNPFQKMLLDGRGARAAGVGRPSTSTSGG